MHPASFDPEPSVPIEHAPAESELRERFQRLARTEDLIAQLICLLLQNGASSELVELYDSVQSSLRRWVMSLGVPRVEAGMIARDVISELYAHWRDLKNPEKAGGYARTILFRLVRKLQAERRRARRRAGLSEDIPGPRGTVAVEESLEAEDSFWHIIRTLGPPPRVIFILRYAGSGNREIADCLGLSLRTVERLVAQIRQRAGPLVDPQR